eukprot:486484_1
MRTIHKTIAIVQVFRPYIAPQKHITNPNRHKQSNIIGTISLINEGKLKQRKHIIIICLLYFCLRDAIQLLLGLASNRIARIVALLLSFNLANVVAPLSSASAASKSVVSNRNICGELSSFFLPFA